MYGLPNRVVMNGRPLAAVRPASLFSKAASGGARSIRPLDDAERTKTDATIASNSGAIARTSSMSLGAVRSLSSTAFRFGHRCFNTDANVRLGAATPHEPG